MIRNLDTIIEISPSVFAEKKISTLNSSENIDQNINMYLFSLELSQSWDILYYDTLFTTASKR